MVESRSMVNGASPGPPPAAQARASSSRLPRTGASWRWSAKLGRPAPSGAATCGQVAVATRPTAAAPRNVECLNIWKKGDDNGQSIRETRWITRGLGTEPGRGGRRGRCCGRRERRRASGAMVGAACRGGAASAVVGIRTGDSPSSHSSSIGNRPRHIGRCGRHQVGSGEDHLGEPPVEGFVVAELLEELGVVRQELGHGPF